MKEKKCTLMQHTLYKSLQKKKEEIKVYKKKVLKKQIEELQQQTSLKRYVDTYTKHNKLALTQYSREQPDNLSNGGQSSKCSLFDDQEQFCDEYLRR